MKKILLFSLTLFSFVYSNGQRIFNVDNCVAITSYLAVVGDTLVIGCDSVYLLNKKTFTIYQIAYEKWKGRDVNVKQAFNTYETLVQLQGKRIDEQDLEYNQLKMQFDSLAISSGKFIDRTGNKLGELTDVMNKVNENLNSALAQIHETEEILKTEKKKRIKSSVTWGVGGFTIGLLTCLLIK